VDWRGQNQSGLLPGATARWAAGRAGQNRKPGRKPQTNVNQKMKTITTPHTKGAVKCAEIILGNYDSIFTRYGKKTVEGLADLIDIETNAPALLAENERLRGALEQVQSLARAGVVQRSETGKGQWTLTDELKRITAAALGKGVGE
jgi:hypothetical protein